MEYPITERIPARRAVDPRIEYLYTVRVVKTGEIKQVRARAMNGVALQLKLELDDIVYLTKVKVL